jgi:hypothetical protein
MKTSENFSQRLQACDDMALGDAGRKVVRLTLVLCFARSAQEAWWLE